LIRGKRIHLHFLAAQHFLAPVALQALVPQTHFLAQQGSLHAVQGLGPQHLVPNALQALVPQLHFLAQQGSLHLLQGLGPQHLVPQALQALVPQTHFLAQHGSLHLLQARLTTATLAGQHFLAIVFAILKVGSLFCLIIL